MNIKHLTFVNGTAVGLIGFRSAVLADGKATYDAICAECHEADDFEGESADDLKEVISQIVNGEIDHKKDLSKLSDQEVADMAVFYASGGK